MTFKELSLIHPILSALEQKGYQTPTPIQEKSIPVILSGKDIFGCAQTGTGKTAAFSLPLLQLLTAEKEKNPTTFLRVLILAPTRELASQISENIATYSTHLPIKHATIFGGVSQVPQVKALKNGVDIIVSTPGRLLDLMDQGYIHLNNIKHFVLDEADKMLDMGFIHDLRKIIKKLPSVKQSLFFSATAAPEIVALSKTILREPVSVSVTPVSSASELVKQRVYYVNKGDKQPLLKHLIKQENIQHVLVFTRTKRGADKVAKDLNKNGIKAEAIHGNKSQGARERALSGFKNKTITALIATDIASRGIDVDKLSHVINFELPEVPETYVHRIGRTGRAGSEGMAFSFCTPEEKGYLNDINKLIKKNIEPVIKHPYNN